MQFLVFGKPEQKLMDNGSSEEIKRLRVEELAKTREYYSKGLLRNSWLLGDHNGVLCLFEADSIEQLNEFIAGYPFISHGYIRPEIFTLAPYPGLGSTNS
jgi:muconolactone delta-isomerase